MVGAPISARYTKFYTNKMEDNKEAIFIILGLFIIIGLAWEPMRNYKGSQLSPNFFPASTSTTSVYDYNNYNSNLGSSADTDPSISPYKGKVTMSYIAGLNNPDPSQEYIPLYTNLGAGEKVDITGWKIQSSRTGNWVKIGKASLLPLPPSKEQSSDVVVRQGDVVYLVKGFSPVGVSFRNNKCTGYLAEDREFYPSMSRDCPRTINENLPSFSTNLDRDDECRALIERIPACTTPERYTNFKKLPDTISSSCKDYLKTQVNYNTCVAKHSSDTDFQGKTWYVYFNLFGPLWRSKTEKITLYDNNGLEVSSYSY